MNMMERQASIAEKALELVKQKASELQGKPGDIKLKLAETANILFARDKEFADFKGEEKAWKQTYYNSVFRDTENSAGPVIFQSQKFGFMEGWMIVVNTLGLPDDSPFKSTNRVPLLEDPEIETEAEE